MLARLLRAVALLVNAGQLAYGASLAARPRVKGDVWAGLALCGLALVSAGAVLLAGYWSWGRLARRLRRIALILNTLLLAAALLLLAGALAEEDPGAGGVAASLALALGPLLTLAALTAGAVKRGQGSGDAAPLG